MACEQFSVPNHPQARPNVTIRLGPRERATLQAVADLLRGVEGSRVPVGNVVGRAARLLYARLERQYGRQQTREYVRLGRVARLGFDPYAPETHRPGPHFDPDTVVKGDIRVDE